MTKAKLEGAKAKPHRGARRASAKGAESPKMHQAEGASAQHAADAKSADDKPGEFKPGGSNTSEAKSAAAVDFAAQLDKGGASACHSQVNALAIETMGHVEKFNTVSNWSEIAGNKRAVSLSIGQKYADGSAVPFGVSQIIAAPNPQNSCDTFVVQVLPSPLACAKLRDSIIAQRGTQIGDLAGVALMQDGTGRTMLVPTAAGTCVLVASRTVYGK